jgi:hypothetical protein
LARTRKNPPTVCAAGGFVCSVSVVEAHGTGRRDTTDLQSRLTRFRSLDLRAVNIHGIVDAGLGGGQGLSAGQCVSAYITTLIPTAYPSGENL